MSAFSVRSQRDIVYIADSEQRVDIRFMRLSRQRIAQENNQINFFSGYECADLLVTAERAGHKAFDRQVGIFGDNFTGCGCSDKVVLAEDILVLIDEVKHFFFFAVVGNQSDRLHNKHQLCFILENKILNVSISYYKQQVNRNYRKNLENEKKNLHGRL